MSRILYTVLLCVLSLPEVRAFQNEADGFGGIKWNTPIQENISQMWTQSASTTNSDIVYYKRRNDKQLIGSLVATDIAYVYYKDRFAYVQFQANGASNIVKAFASKYGQGERQSLEREYFLWHGPATVITLQCPSANSDCHARYFSASYLKEVGVTMPAPIRFDKAQVENKARSVYEGCSKKYDSSVHVADSYFAECELQRQSQWKAGLEQLYGELVKHVGGTCQDKLRHAQDAWFEQQQADYAAIDAIFQSWPVNARRVASRKTAYLVARVEYLYSLLYAVQEADPFDARLRDCVVFQR